MELKKSRLIPLIFIIVLVVAYLFIAKIYVPGLVKSEIAKFGEERGVALSVGGASFGIFRGLVLSDTKLGDSISVDTIELRPSFLEFLSSGELLIESILVDRPLVTVDDNLPETIIRIQKSDDKEPGRNIEIRNIDIDDLVIKAGGSEYSLSELDIEMPVQGDEEDSLQLRGRLENDSLRQEVSFISDIEFRDNKNLKVDVAFTDLKKGDITGFLRFPHDLSIYISAIVDYSEGLDSRGKLTIINSLDKTEEGVVVFDLSHEEESKNLAINSLNGNIGEVLSLDMKGLAGNLPDNGIVKLNGNLNVPEASGLEPWLPFLDSIKISGSLNTENIYVKKEGDITTVIAGIESDNFLLDFGENNKIAARNLSTKDGLEFIYTNENDKTRYGLKLRETEYSDFIYTDYESSAGTIKSLDFNFKEGIWDVKLTSGGPGVLNESLGVMLSDYLLNLVISSNEELEISGDIKGVDGSYGVFSLLTFFTNFKYLNNKIEFNSASAGIETYGDFFVDSGSLSFPPVSGGEYLLEIKDTKFIYTDPGINAENIKGLFTIKAAGEGSTAIEGRIVAENANVYTSVIKNLNFDYYSLGDDYKISSITGGFLGGNLGGSLGFKTLEESISFETAIKLSGVKNGSLNAEGVNFDSKGHFSSGHFKDTKGVLKFNDLFLGQGYTEVDFDGELDFTVDPETISIVKGFISNDEGKRFEFTGGLNNYAEEKRDFKLLAPEIPLDFLIDVFSSYLPDSTFVLDVEGVVSVDFDALNILSDDEIWNGLIKIKDSTVSAFINNADVLLEDVEGSITIREIDGVKNRLVALLGKDLTIDRSVYKKYLAEVKQEADTETRDYLKIGKLQYGFFEMNNIEAKFEMDNDELNLIYLRSDVYNGNIFASGIFNYGDSKENYNINLLFSRLSLKSISDSLPSMEGYITGVIDGLIWFSVGNGYTTINGPFSFWARDGKGEKRTIGRALLEKIGAKGRFFTGSSRRYDKGEIAGYIKDGFITFKKLIISNRILGYTDLKIKVDDRQNSITVKHLFSVIRELARRASRGDVEIDFQ